AQGRERGEPGDIHVRRSGELSAADLQHELLEVLVVRERDPGDRDLVLLLVRLEGRPDRGGRSLLGERPAREREVCGRELPGVESGGARRGGAGLSAAGHASGEDEGGGAESGELQELAA